MFGEIAERYDLMNHLLSGGVDVYWRARTIRQVAPEGDAPILDVCTGTGDLALAYWKRGAGRIAVTGSDFTPEMLDLARQKVERTAKSLPVDAAGIEFIQADTQQLPFESDTYQIVSVAFGLRNVTDTRRGLDEMIRVCQPGGRVAILEFSQPTQPLLGAGYRWYFKNVLPRIGQFFARNRQAAYHYLPQSVSEFPCGADLAAILEERGLVEVTWTPLTFGIATLYVGRKPAKSSGPGDSSSDEG